MIYKTKKEFKKYVRKNGYICYYERAWLRKNTKLKEFYFVRYADDFKIICKIYNDAVKLKIATIQWLQERLNLEVSEEKTKIVNLKKNYSNFLGFKMKVRKKSKNSRYTIISHIEDKAKVRVKTRIKSKLKDIKKSITPRQIESNLNECNQIIIGAHNYYNKATFISIDMSDINYRLNNLKFKALKETIDFQVPNYRNNGFIEKTYGTSKQLVELYGMYIVLISYMKYKRPIQQSNDIFKYTKEGRIKIHTGLECMNYETIKDIVDNPLYDETIGLNDIIIPKYASRYGVCYVSEIEIKKNNLDFIYKSNTLKDKDFYQNIIVVDKNIKGLLLREGCGIKEMRKKFKKKGNNGKKTLV